MSRRIGVPGGPLAAAILGLAFGSLICGAAVAQEGRTFVSTRPTPRVEYWQTRLMAIEARLSAAESLAPVRLLFLGDSITDFWTLGENPWFPGAFGGRTVWAESFEGATPDTLGLNLGISGDRTEHVLQRILPKSEGGLGQLDRPDLDPDVIVLMIGINNSWDAEAPAVESVYEGIIAVVSAVHRHRPRAAIVLHALLPTHEPDRNAGLVVPVNRALADFVAARSQDGYLHFLDLYPAFLDADGHQNRALFMDGVHPNESGYRVWRDQLVPVLAAIR
jgi:lysophospholipase L1-like esterase